MPDSRTRFKRSVRRVRSLGNNVKLRLLSRDHPGLNGLDRRLERFVDFDGGFFIEAGANDGWQQSNTYYLERRRGWTGLLVEPIPALAEQCRRRRPKSNTVSCALVPFDFEADTIKIHYAGLMSLVEGAQSSHIDVAEHVQSGLDVQGIRSSYAIDVHARTLSSLLEEFHPQQPIDLLSLDVEGYELSVLKGLDLTRHRPSVMLIECRYEDEITEYLAGFNYLPVDRLSPHDVVFVDQAASR